MVNIERIYNDETTVLNTDTFDRQKFAFIATKAEKLHEAVENMAKDNQQNVALMGDMFNALYKMKPAIKKREEEFQKDDKTDILTELMNQNNILNEDSNSQSVNEELMKRILQNENYDKMRKTTRLDEFTSALGTMRLSEIVHEWVQEQRKNDNQFNEQMNQLKQLQKQMQSNQEQLQKREEKGQKPTKKQAEQKEQLQQQYNQLQQQLVKSVNQKMSDNTVSSLIQKATNETQKEKEDVQNLLGGGTSSGEGELRKLPLNEQLKLAAILRDSENVKKIAEWAGKFKSIARKKQKAKHTESIDYSGMTVGDDVERLLPQELAQYVKAETRLDFLRRFSEKQTMMYSPEGKETLGKGPIVICLDESGSMFQLANQSKGFVLAVAMIAKSQNRDFCVIPFSNKIGEMLVCEKGKVTTEHIIQLASNFLSGGTHYMPPLNAAIEYIKNNKRFKKSDIIFVTDGNPSDKGALDKGLTNFNQERKKHTIQVMSLLIGNDVDRKYVDIFSDCVINAKDFNSENAMEIFKI